VNYNFMDIVLHVNIYKNHLILFFENLWGVW
jgi:hypothetical protein